MAQQKIKLLSLVIISGLTVSCSNGSISLLNKSVPNEFKVISNPPLSVPPDFSVLPPKQTAKPSIATDLELTTSAEDMLFNSDEYGKQSVKLSSGEKALLNLAAVDSARMDIKQLVDSEYQDSLRKKEEKNNIFKKVIAYTRGEETKNDPLVSPNREKRRIEDNKKDGKPAAEGEVKVIEEGGKQGLLNRVFGF